MKLPPRRYVPKIPYDIKCVIVEHLDFSTLKNISLVCHDFKHAAAKHLWWSYTIDVSDPSLGPSVAQRNVEDKVGLILSDERAPYIRVLRFHLMVRLSITPDDYRSPLRTVSTLFKGLERATNLQSLEIRAMYHEKEIVDALSTRAFAPNLVRLGIGVLTSISWDDLDGFWVVHPALRSLTLLGHTILGPVHTLALPNLEALHLARASQSVLMRGCPITNLTIDVMSDRDCPSLAENIQLSTKDLLHLNITISSGTSTIFSVVISQLRYLRTLRISCEAFQDEHHRIIAAATLSSLRDLEILEWHGVSPNTQEEVLIACSMPGQALRRVVFSHYETFPAVRFFSRTLVRREDSWVPEPDEK